MEGGLLLVGFPLQTIFFLVDILDGDLLPKAFFQPLYQIQVELSYVFLLTYRDLFSHIVNKRLEDLGWIYIFSICPEHL
jgi:hypothetical protein